MKNFLKKLLIFLFIAASIYGVGRLILVTYDSYLHVPRAPYAVMQTQDAITIKWQTPEFEVGSLEYGFFSDSMNTKIRDKKQTKKHSITISGLNECTKYYYKVSSDSLDIDNEDRSFKTLCKNADSQKIWVIGDSGEAGKDQDRVYSQMLKHIDKDFNKLDMWILLGDNAYRSGTQKQYNKNMFEPYKELVKRFVPWAIIGNHDDRRWAFYNIWDFPTKGESGGEPSGSEKYYSINNGNLHLVMLDSEMRRIDANSDMVAWLRKDLSKNTKPWVIVALHTPPYTDGGHNSDSDYDSGGRMKKVRENLVPVFDEFGVDLVLSGHSHDYERSKLIAKHTGKGKSFNKQNIVQDAKSCYSKSIKPAKNSGTIYQVCGSSAKLDQANLKHPALPFAFQEMGSIILDITPTTLSSKFINIDGKIMDEFIIKKDNTSCEGKK
ncbi:metallophosphoesterase [Sulfurimonas gotlandica GD1]|uniref:Metallophosphoesterase n=1 Tax=Sulfurimonas gotlandica (strain DSM 19862 / JCM 16533 / GD1) TaxID=929558 RepID=B6BJT6_SULGG|nr:metallophosphoesterase family protein [Sulfurimonas gotlandica]EDZ62675.1 Ser/Thr protein phosphatase family protein [Sulfurimonas gotlandica GD1]EHP31336.1 metallophosphoesterase [Sulfurimonas gotlandica GD1]